MLHTFSTDIATSYYEVNWYINYGCIN